MQQKRIRKEALITSNTKKGTKPVKKSIEVGVFQEDEMYLGSVSPGWNGPELLAQTGIFYLKDIVPILKLDAEFVLRKARYMESKQQNPWLIMGIRRMWRNYIVRMTVFSKYYQMTLCPRHQSLSPDWDRSDFINQSGLFLLSDACKLLPYRHQELRRKATRLSDQARSELGIWKDPAIKRYLLDMDRFRQWHERQQN